MVESRKGKSVVWWFLEPWSLLSAQSAIGGMPIKVSKLGRSDYIFSKRDGAAGETIDQLS